MVRAKRMVAVAVLALAACAIDDVTEPPQVSLVDLKMQDVSLFEQKAGIVLRIRNPNDSALAVDGCRFTLTVNGQPFATGMSGASFTVPRLGEATTTADASISTLDLVRQVAQAPNAQAFEYKLSGTLFLSGGLRRSVAFEQSGRLDSGFLQGQ